MMLWRGTSQSLIGIEPLLIGVVRLCRNDLSGLFELQSWKTSLRKPTTPHIRDVFDLPPTSPLLSGGSSPTPSELDLGSESTSSELDTPEWALEENSLLSTPESSQFPFDDPAQWSPENAGEDVEIVEVGLGRSPVFSRYSLEGFYPPPPRLKSSPGSSDNNRSTPRLSRRSSTASLRSVRILNFDEHGLEGLSPALSINLDFPQHPEDEPGRESPWP